MTELDGGPCSLAALIVHPPRPRFARRAAASAERPGPRCLPASWEVYLEGAVLVAVDSRDRGALPGADARVALLQELLDLRPEQGARGLVSRRFTGQDGLLIRTSKRSSIRGDVGGGVPGLGGDPAVGREQAERPAAAGSIETATRWQSQIVLASARGGGRARGAGAMPSGTPPPRRKVWKWPCSPGRSCLSWAWQYHWLWLSGIEHVALGVVVEDVEVYPGA